MKQKGFAMFFTGRVGHGLSLSLVLAWGFAVAACSGNTTGGLKEEECGGNAVCEAGWVCSDNACAKLCDFQSDCGGEEYCSPAGICAPLSDGPAPQITAVIGNRSDDASAVLDGIVVSGFNLDTSSFEFRAADGEIPVTVRTSSSTEVELVLPADIVSGEYALVATNSAGSAQESVILTLPELTGDMLVDRINSGDTSARISLQRLEVEVQERVDGACSGDSSIQSIAADGTVVCRAASAGLNEGLVPTVGAAGLVDGSIYDTGAGNVGIGFSEPVGLLDVGTGFSYVWEDAVLDTPDPRCDCDQADTAFDCKPNDDPEHSFSSTYFQGNVCYDIGTGGVHRYRTVSEPTFTVTPEGSVGVGIAAPEATLHVNGDLKVTGEFEVVSPTVGRRLDLGVYSHGFSAIGGSRSVYVNGALVSTSGRGLHLTVLSGSDGSVIHSQTYDTHIDVATQGPLLATALATYNASGNILIINSNDQPAYGLTGTGDLAVALRDIMKSRRIVTEGIESRGAVAIVYQNGRGCLGEDVSNSIDGTVRYGDSVNAVASVNVVAYVGP